MSTMTRMQRIERELTRSQRRTVAEGGSVEITGTPALPADCTSCLHPITYWLDPEGIWTNCACDGGYLQ
jgi:hypothetical protein